MRKRKYNLEVKVGIFVFLALILLVILIFSIADFHLFKKGYNLEIYFNYIGGLEVGAPVRLAGVKIGEIKNINVVHKEDNGKTIVVLKAWIKDKTFIRADSLATINTLGLLGEKYLEISPGEKGKILRHNDVLVGEDPVPMSVFTAAGYDAFKKLQKVVDAASDWFGDENVVDSLKSITLNFKKMTDNLVDVTYDTQNIIERINKGEGTMGKLLLDDSLYKDVDDFFKDIKSNPWKLLYKPPSRDNDLKGNRGYINK